MCYLGMVLTHTVEKWNTSCHISKQRCHSHQQLQSSNVSGGAPRALRKERRTCDCQAAATPCGEPQGSSECKKYKILAQIAEMHIKGMVSYAPQPRFLHLPLCRKALNSLIWVIWFSLVNSNLSTFRLPVLCRRASI